MNLFDETSLPNTSAIGNSDSIEEQPTPTVLEPTDEDSGAGASNDSIATELQRRDRLGRHVVLERIGAGGMGVVYAAYDPKLDRKIAIKLLHPGAGGRRQQERLLREAQALAKLDDPNVVKVFDIGTAGSLIYVAMEYVPGINLLRWIADKPRAPKDILTVFEAAGRGLAAAHNAGLVHRDFKSNNVLVRDDGQVKVLDFGLARTTGDGDQQVLEADLLEQGLGATHHGLDATLNQTAPELTVAGSILGTPAYMAPEQRRGEELEPAADQFAFCVSLYCALYDQWPFAKGRDDADRPRGDVAADWRVVEPRPTPRVPSRLLGVLTRGLSFSPQDRYESMEALLADLRREPWYRHPTTKAFAALFFLSLILGVLVSNRLARQIPCRGAQAQLAEVWNAQRSLDLTTAFDSTGEVYAADAARVVGSILDDYASRWVTMHTEACEATHVRREQSAELLDRRVACLDSRHGELGALVNLFTQWPADTVLHSVEAVSALAPISTCGDTITLMAPIAAPDDAEVRTAVAATRQRIAEAHAHRLAGRFDQGLVIARRALEAAEELEYWPLIAEALLLLGSQLEATSDDQARVILERSLLASQAGGHDRIAAEALVRLVRITGYQDAENEAAQNFGRLAEALLSRLGKSPALHADLADHLGLVFLRSGDLEAALAQHLSALRLRRENGGETPEAAIARSHLRIGSVLKELGDLDAAREQLEMALELYYEILGPTHPEVAANLDRLGGLALDAGDYDSAATFYRRALEILEQGFGDRHVRLGDTLSNYGLVYLSSGRTAEAMEIFLRVESIFQEAYGDDHPNLAALLTNVGSALIDQHRPADALVYFERVQRIHTATFGTLHPSTGLSLYNVGEAHLALENYPRALEHHAGALDIWLAELPSDHFLIAHGYAGRGRALAGLGQNQRAVTDLEEALRIWSDAGRDPVYGAETELALARSLWQLGDQQRALALGRSAHITFSAASGRYHALRDEAAEWLHQHATETPVR